MQRRLGKKACQMEKMHRVGRFSASNVGGNGQGFQAKTPFERALALSLTCRSPAPPPSGGSSMDIARPASPSSSNQRPRPRLTTTCWQARSVKFKAPVEGARGASLEHSGGHRSTTIKP